MPSEKSARQSARRYQRNRAVRRATRTAVTNAVALVKAEDAAAALPAILDAMKALDRAAKKGVLHNNNAARRKSRLAAKLNALKQQAS